MATKELLIVVAGLVVMLAVNRLLLARELAPLERAAAAMRRADPLAPGQRVLTPGHPSEASDLAVALNAMAGRLEMNAATAPGGCLALRRASGCGSRASCTTRSASSPPRCCGARGSLDDVRRVARVLRSEALDDLGLPSALAALSERLAGQAGLRVEHQLQPVLPPLTAEEELVMYRVAQEALTNVLRHAGTGSPRPIPCAARSRRPNAGSLGQS